MSSSPSHTNSYSLISPCTELYIIIIPKADNLQLELILDSQFMLESSTHNNKLGW